MVLTEDAAATFENDWSLSGVTIIGGLTLTENEHNTKQWQAYRYMSAHRRAGTVIDLHGKKAGDTIPVYTLPSLSACESCNDG